MSLYLQKNEIFTQVVSRNEEVPLNRPITKEELNAFLREYLKESLFAVHEPLNLRTGKFDGKVLTSIKSDVAVLNALSRIISIMFTCNQALLMNPALNNYEE